MTGCLRFQLTMVSPSWWTVILSIPYLPYAPLSTALSWGGGKWLIQSEQVPRAQVEAEVPHCHPERRTSCQKPTLWEGREHPLAPVWVKLASGSLQLYCPIWHGDFWQLGHTFCNFPSVSEDPAFLALVSRGRGWGEQDRCSWLLSSWEQGCGSTRGSVEWSGVSFGKPTGIKYRFVLLKAQREKELT